MNYRHAYHAGNHADILKHVVVSRILTSLKDKPNPFSVLDTHAGIGLYRLMSEEAGKTLEWQSGIGKMEQAFAPDIEALLEPFRSCVSACGTLAYPGSPTIAAHLARKEDKLIFNELHPEDHLTLEQLFENDKRVYVTRDDATIAVKSKLPFPNRRGLVLIDPPFEVTDETERTVRMLGEGLRRMPTAVFMIWYPVKTSKFAIEFATAISGGNPPNLLQAEVMINKPKLGSGLAGSGVLIVNSPWKLHDELALLVPALAERLGTAEGRGFTRWLKPRP